MTASVKGLFDFIRNAPTPYHAVETISGMLRENGFFELKEGKRWSLTPGGKYYVTRNRSSVLAFVLPADGSYNGFQIVASHCDSPTFKIKSNAEIVVRKEYVQLNTERYGGMLCAPWMDRPLSVAGRVLVQEKNGVSTRLVNIDKDMVLIPNVAIHMNRTANDGIKYNAQVDMLPLYGDGNASGGFMKEIAAAAGVEEEKILDTDLFLYNCQPGTVWGANEEYISSPKLDDLECAYTSLQAFLTCVPEKLKSIPMCCVFDNEEVGSTTKQGADSTVLYDTLRRMTLALGKDEEELYTAIAASVMLSADNAHSVHPNHPEYTDPTNQVFMNKGIVIKYNANQKYTTDGVSGAIFRSICGKAGVPTQTFFNRSDMLGGNTLGNISNSHVSLNTIDIGLAQLAMHSSYETAGAKDVDYMIDGIAAFFNSSVTTEQDGEYHF